MLARILPFYIVVEFDRKKRRLKVVQTDYNEHSETFVVRANNGEMTFSSNRPYLRGARLKRREPMLRMESGQTRFQSLDIAIAQAIIDHLMKVERQANKR